MQCHNDLAHICDNTWQMALVSILFRNLQCPQLVPFRYHPQYGFTGSGVRVATRFPALWTTLFHWPIPRATVLHSSTSSYVLLTPLSMKRCNLKCAMQSSSSPSTGGDVPSWVARIKLFFQHFPPMQSDPSLMFPSEMYVWSAPPSYHPSSCG